MAKNAVQRGHVVALPAPTGGVVSGQAVIVGVLFAIAYTDAAEGDLFEAQLTGVWTLPKVPANTPAAGAAAYWNAGASQVTTTASGNTLIGAFTEAAVNGDTTCNVRLNGVSV